MSSVHSQWGRRVSVILQGNGRAIELSQLHIRFNVQNADEESPNTANIRVYNLTPATLLEITGTGEFNGVVLNAGYEGRQYGIIFKGTIKQYKIGRENGTDTYLDILAADGDIWYNQSVVNLSFDKSFSNKEKLKAIVGQTKDMGLNMDSLTMDTQHYVNPRGCVKIGMARSQIRNLVSHLNATWTIENGTIVVTDLTGYVEGEAVVITRETGMVGIPEQTGEGIRVQCLLNPLLRIGGAVKLDNASINVLQSQDPNSGVLTQYDKWSPGPQMNAALNPDGIYRAYVIEHEGDSRGTMWYSHITCLSVDPTQPREKSVGNM